MAALVGYASSDEEDDASQTIAEETQDVPQSIHSSSQVTTAKGDNQPSPAHDIGKTGKTASNQESG